MPQRQLGELMTELGLISEEQLATVLEVQQQSNRPLGQIIVELGFASGAAVAHALAMQSGGALRTEYGFALGAPPVADEATAEETRTDLPRLRLAATAVAPPPRTNPEPVEGGQGAAAAEPAAVDEQPEPAAIPATPEPDEPESAKVATDADEAVEAEEIPGAEETAAPEPEPEPEEVSAEVPQSAEAPLAAEIDPAELEQLRGEIGRLEAALAETQAAHEQKLAGLRDEHEQATAELERLQASAAEQDRLLAEIVRLEAALGEAQTTHEQNLNRLQEEREEAALELDALHASLAEAEKRHAGERDELAAQRDRIQEELSDALERFAGAEPAAEAQDRLRAEVEQLESTLAEAHAAAEAERERLQGDVDRLESVLSEARAAHEEELGLVRKKHERAREELDGLQAALAEAQTLAAEQERRLAEEQERQADEREGLAAQRERLQEELGAALERIAVLGPVAEERDELRAEVEQLHATLADVRETSTAELRGATEERDSLAAELEEARELLRQAERNRAMAELERLQTIATDAQTEAEEGSRLLAEEQDRHHAERETLLAQRTMLEQELGSSIEQLAAAAADGDEREARLQLGSQKLLEALDAVRRLAAELVPGSEKFPEEASTVEAEAEVEAEADAERREPEAGANDAEADEIDYSLFVPGPNGYELIPQTGVPPQAGQRVKLVLSDEAEPVLYEVARSGRTLPGGDVCVYLAQV